MEMVDFCLFKGKGKEEREGKKDYMARRNHFLDLVLILVLNFLILKQGFENKPIPFCPS